MITGTITGKDYLLMHKDIPVCGVCFDPDTGAVLDVDIINRKHTPISVTDRRTFANWWDRRAIPQNQMQKEILLGSDTRRGYLIRNLGLSLNDHYWIQPASETTYWSDVNLYENDFCEIDFAAEDFHSVIPFKPSASTQGELWKRWIIKNGERCLIKGNYGTACRQSINEVFATRLHGMQCGAHTKWDMPKGYYTEYSLVKLPEHLGGAIECLSKNFTDTHTEFIPCYDITFMKKQPQDMSVYEHYIQTCVGHGLPEKMVRGFMEYQIMTDFLLTNTDRHLRNLGILRDSRTLEWKGMAPIFDSGNSMFFNQMYSEGTVHAVKTNSFAGTELKMLEYVRNRNAVDIVHIPGAELIDRLYKYDEYSRVYLDNMKRGYDKKVEMLDAFQRGYSLNPRSSRYYGGAVFGKESKEVPSSTMEGLQEIDI